MCIRWELWWRGALTFRAIAFTYQAWCETDIADASTRANFVSRLHYLAQLVGKPGQGKRSAAAVNKGTPVI